MARCVNCSRESITISRHLGVCVDCIRNDFDTIRPHIEEVHAGSRERFGLKSGIVQV